MKLEQIKNYASAALVSVIADDIKLSDEFTVVEGDCLNGGSGELDEDEQVSIRYDILFSFRGCEHKHAIIIGWNELDGVGLEHGEEGDVMPITAINLLTSLYLDFALADLEPH